MGIWNICGVALICVFLSLTLKECGGRFSSLVGIIGGFFILLFCIEGIYELYNKTSEWAYLESASPYIMTAVKVLSLGYAVSLTADTCRELGEGGIASKLELFGKIEMLLLCMPRIEEILSLALSLSEKK
ncbi:MAG: stage III sporulation AC/AD family protein [Clostridia bacterium]|jgi:stage III sporulation protein AD|nr:stage III sporulation AC/AD family protein [Clostridia bacterium]MBQ5800260.1 stage III sporulation AC/AD family protein [Clostridia bacterium]